MYLLSFRKTTFIAAWFSDPECSFTVTVFSKQKLEHWFERLFGLGEFMLWKKPPIHGSFISKLAINPILVGGEGICPLGRLFVITVPGERLWPKNVLNFRCYLLCNDSWSLIKNLTNIGENFLAWLWENHQFSNIYFRENSTEIAICHKEILQDSFIWWNISQSSRLDGSCAPLQFIAFSWFWRFCHFSWPHKEICWRKQYWWVILGLFSYSFFLCIINFYILMKYMSWRTISTHNLIALLINIQELGRGLFCPPPFVSDSPATTGLKFSFSKTLKMIK